MECVSVVNGEGENGNKFQNLFYCSVQLSKVPNAFCKSKIKQCIIHISSFEDTRKCTFGDKCTQAHSKDELQEWKERFKFRKQQIKRARDKHLHGNTYAEQLMEKLVNAENSKSVVSMGCYIKKEIRTLLVSDLKVCIYGVSTLYMCLMIVFVLSVKHSNSRGLLCPSFVCLSFCNTLQLCNYEIGL